MRLRDHSSGAKLVDIGNSMKFVKRMDLPVFRVHRHCFWSPQPVNLTIGVCLIQKTPRLAHSWEYGSGKWNVLR
jgi:hypothetical protein